MRGPNPGRQKSNPDKAAANRKHQENKEGSNHANQPGAQNQLRRLDGGDESMLERFRPEIIEQDIGHINLANLNHTHSDNADKNEPGLVGVQLQKARQKPHRKEAHHRPEKDLEEAEDIPLRNDPILKHKGPCLNQCSL